MLAIAYVDDAYNVFSVCTLNFLKAIIIMFCVCAGRHGPLPGTYISKNEITS